MYFVFLLLWIVFNGKVTLEIVLIGLLVSALIYWFCCKFLGYSYKNEIKALKNTPLGAKYALLLLKEIFMANIIVFRLLYTDKKIKPVLYHFNVGLKSSMAKVLLSYSITLTPGTITVELKDDEFVVHCLDESLAEGLETSAFVKLLSKMERN